MNPLFIGILAFVGVATLVGGVVMLFSPPQTSRIEDRLNILTGVASPAGKDNLLKDNSVLSRPLDDAPTMLAQWFQKLANFDLIFAQADNGNPLGRGHLQHRSVFLSHVGDLP